MMTKAKFDTVTQLVYDMFIDSHKGYQMKVDTIHYTITVNNLSTGKFINFKVINVVGTFVTVKCIITKNFTMYQLNSFIFGVIGHN